MAGHKEICSFVTKYLELWQSGHDAKMVLTCKAGKASVQINLDIDLLPPPLPQGDRPRLPRKPGPSRLRRRTRRAEERARAAVVAAEAAATTLQTLDVAAEQAVHDHSIDSATQDLVEDKTMTEDAAVEAVVEKETECKFETADDISINLGGIQVFKTSTPKKQNQNGHSRSYRQNCKQCFHNSVCVDCFVDWHKENKQEYYRKY